MRVGGNRKERIAAFLFFIFCFVHLDIDGVCDGSICFYFFMETIIRGGIVLVIETWIGCVMG